MVGDGRTEALLAASAPIMAELVWDRQPQPTAHLLAVAQGPALAEARDRIPKGLKKAPSTGRTPAPYSALGPKVGAIWFGNVPSKPQL